MKIGMLALALALVGGCLSAESRPGDEVDADVDADVVGDTRLHRGAPACTETGITVESPCVPGDGGPWFAASVADTGEPCALCALEFTSRRPNGCTVATPVTFAVDGRVICVSTCGVCH